jgi:hypothetical protein
MTGANGMELLYFVYKKDLGFCPGKEYYDLDLFCHCQNYGKIWWQCTIVGRWELKED